MKTKLFYTAPVSNILEVRFEGVIATSDYTEGGGGSYNDDTTNDNGNY